MLYSRHLTPAPRLLQPHTPRLTNAHAAAPVLFHAPRTRTCVAHNGARIHQQLQGNGEHHARARVHREPLQACAAGLGDQQA